MLIIILNVMITLLMIVNGHVDRGIDGCLANGDYGHIPNSVDDHSDHGDIGLLMVLIITDNTCAVYGYIVNIDGNITNVDAGHIANIDGNITNVDAGHIANGDAGHIANVMMVTLLMVMIVTLLMMVLATLVMVMIVTLLMVMLVTLPMMMVIIILFVLMILVLLLMLNETVDSKKIFWLSGVCIVCMYCLLSHLIFKVIVPLPTILCFFEDNLSAS